MENDVFEALQDIGYSGPILEDGGFEVALEKSYKSNEFRHAIVWLTAELNALCKLDEQVSDVTSPEDTSSFLLELNSFLVEIGCQYRFLTEGHLSENLQNQENALLLLHFLVSELQAARMIAVKRPTNTPFMEIKLQETSTASELKSLLMALKFGKPPDNIHPAQLFEKVEQRARDVVAKAPADLQSKPIFTGVMSDKQWHTIEDVQLDLHKEYRMRREMLIKRLDVTIQSFQWSDRAKNKTEQIAAAMSGKRKAMNTEPSVRLSDLLAAREDVAIIEKTSSASVRKNTKSNLNKVIIGKVPDRGGRTTDQAPPPPEMPSWQKDRNPGVGGRGGGGGGGGGSGFRGGGRGGGGGGGGDRNRVQGGWNHGSNDRGQDRRQGNERGQGWNQGGDNRAQGWNRGGDNRDQGRGYNDQGKGYRDQGGYQDHRDRDRGHHNYDDGYHRGGGYHGGRGGGGGRGGRRDNR